MDLIQIQVLHLPIKIMLLKGIRYEISMCTQLAFYEPGSCDE